MGIELSKVSFAYYIPKSNKKPIYFNLNNVNLKIDSQDEFIAIVGHTGSGKSTLVQLLNALQFPSSGNIKINDKDNIYEISKNIDNSLDNKKYRKKLIKKPKLDFKLKPLRKYTGLVFQFPEYQIFEETVLKDIQFGPLNFNNDKEYAKCKAIEISKIMGIEDLLEKSPFSLSGGQMRKVAIAGILASDPDILVLDEPTVGLDPIAKKDLLQFLNKLNKEFKKSIVIITHDMDVVSEYIKRVLVMKQGRLMYDGSKEQLFKNEQLVKDCNLDFPTIVTTLKEINNKMNLCLDVYQYNLEDAFAELKRKLGEANE